MNVDVILPCAATGEKMRPYGPTAALQVGGEAVAARQVRLLRAAMPGARFFVVAGFEAWRVDQLVRRHARVLLNAEHEHTTPARSVEIGLAAGDPCRGALIVYGDLAFGEPVAAALARAARSGRPSALVETEPSRGREREVGVTVVAGRVTRFAYGLESKWAQALFLPATRRAEFALLARARPRRLTHELLNEMLDGGLELDALPCPGPVHEIDSVGALRRARKCIPS